MTTICPFFHQHHTFRAFSFLAEGADRSHLHNAPDSHDMFVTTQQGQVTIRSGITPQQRLLRFGKMNKIQSFVYLTVWPLQVTASPFSLASLRLSSCRESPILMISPFSALLECDHIICQGISAPLTFSGNATPLCPYTKHTLPRRPPNEAFEPCTEPGCKRLISARFLGQERVKAIRATTKAKILNIISCKWPFSGFLFVHCALVCQGPGAFKTWG